jgi:AraC family transcriptional regulator, transcriptional activator of the genes for pyochelin and ferripyochelin receptors
MNRKTTIIDAEKIFDNPRAGFIADDSSDSEILWKWPGEIGTGFMSRINLGPGLALGFGEFQLFEDIELHFEPSLVPVALHFSGSLHGNYGYNLIDKKIELPLAGSGLGGSIVYRKEWQGAFKFSQHAPVRGLIVYIDPLMLNPFMDGQFDCFPTDLCDITCGNHEKYFYQAFTTTPAVQTVINQVLDCPYTGALKRFYLEARTLEVVTYAMGQLAAEKDHHVNATALHPRDMERVRSIKEILIGNLEKPPSLLELARISGTNKNKLNTDFRQVFGTSVFEFLRANRLEHAKDLLESKKMNVTEAAFEVGYAHQQSFTRAFRSHFGTNPIDHIR